jgi:type VI secretion system secreted protein Hcp
MSEPVVSTRRTLIAGTLTASALGGSLLTSAPTADAAVPSNPASRFFLSIPGIPGESADARHPKTIEPLDWSFGVDNTISPTNTGGGTSKSKPRDFVFVARMSVASPKLFAAAAKGTHFASAQLFADRVAASPFEYLVVTFENLFITSYVVAPSETDAWPMDVVHMDYGKITMTFKPQNQDGSPGTPVTAGFDFILDQAV